MRDPKKDLIQKARVVRKGTQIEKIKEGNFCFGCGCFGGNTPTNPPLD